MAISQRGRCEGPWNWSQGFGDQRRRAASRKGESGVEKEKATAGMAGRIPGIIPGVQGVPWYDAVFEGTSNFHARVY